MAKKAGADLANLGQVAETSRMTVYDPRTDEPFLDDDGNEMWIEVHGQDSERYKAVVHAQANRRIQKAQRGGGRINITAEQQEANGLTLLAKITSNWHLVFHGEVPECTEKTARQLYEDVPWLRDQVDLHVHDRKNFLTGSSAS